MCVRAGLTVGFSLLLGLAGCSSGPGEASVAAGAAETAPVPALKGDRNLCPEAYKTQASVPGRNAGYVVDGQSRDFTLLLPSGSAADPSLPHPILVDFNGTGGNGDLAIQWGHLQDFADKGFIVLAPSSAGNGTVWPVWDGLRQPGTEGDPNKDLDYFDSLLGCVASYVPVAQSGVYVAGHSAGGIMANYVLQRRSELLAGGIVASGVFSLTSPVPAKALDPMFVVVTWGGENDRYQGNGVAFDFIAEASLASKFYHAAPNVAEVNCRGADIGHSWLVNNNAWLADELLAHPKGQAALTGPLPPVPPNAEATCEDQPFEGDNNGQVTCGPSDLDGCQQFCQFAGDCAVENTTIQPVLHDQLVALGFSGDGNLECGGCVTKCAQHGTGTDPQVLSCFKDRQATAACGQGIDGVLPLVDAINGCCENRTDSPFCIDICTILLTQPQAGAFFPTCTALTGN
jgi:predicted esterase